MSKVPQRPLQRKSAPQFSGTVRPNGRIWVSAEQFYKVAEQLWTSEGVDLDACVFPLIVNYALCAELSLKAAEGGAVGGGVTTDGLVMAAKIKSTAHGHNLSDVFASLELPTQVAIESEFLVMSGEQLAPLLAKCSNYFIHARYPYEQIGGSYDLTGIRTLAKGLLDAVRAFGTKNL
jgi:hypothetical protein